MFLCEFCLKIKAINKNFASIPCVLKGGKLSLSFQTFWPLSIKIKKIKLRKKISAYHQLFKKIMVMINSRTQRFWHCCFLQNTERSWPLSAAWNVKIFFFVPRSRLKVLTTVTLNAIVLEAYITCFISFNAMYHQVKQCIFSLWTSIIDNVRLPTFLKCSWYKLLVRIKLIEIWTKNLRERWKISWGAAFWICHIFKRGIR